MKNFIGTVGPLCPALKKYRQAGPPRVTRIFTAESRAYAGLGRVIDHCLNFLRLDAGCPGLHSFEASSLARQMLPKRTAFHSIEPVLTDIANGKYRALAPHARGTA